MENVLQAVQALPVQLSEFLWLLADKCEGYRLANAQPPKLLLLDKARAALLNRYAQGAAVGRQPLLIVGAVKTLLIFDGEELEVVATQQSERFELFG